MLQPNFLPFPILHTKRCLLRQPVIEDASRMFFLRSDERVMRYIDKEPFKSLEEAEGMLTKAAESLVLGTGISWAVCLKEKNEMIGMAGLWRLIPEHYRGEIGYTLDPSFWNQGIMHEVLCEIIRYGFDDLGLHSIEANVNPSNAASIKLLEKNRFVREGYFRENYYFNNRFLDSAIYSLLVSNHRT